MTLTEKILARAAGKTRVEAGDNVWVKADVLMTHDVCGPGTIGVFKREFGENAKVWHPSRVVIIPDHYIFTADSKSNRNMDINSRASVIPLFLPRDTLVRAKFFWALIRTPAWRVLSTNLPPASEIRM